MPVSLIEITAAKRQKKHSINTLKSLEADAITKHIKSGDCVVALDQRGISMTSEALVTTLNHWYTGYHRLSLIIGGPDGLCKQLLTRVNHTLSLSTLTLPHPIARLMLVEQLYRAWSIMHHHPYHR